MKTWLYFKLQSPLCGEIYGFGDSYAKTTEGGGPRFEDYEIK